MIEGEGKSPLPRNVIAEGGRDVVTDAERFQEVVTNQGTLDLSQVIKHEVLYEGRNGKSVVRFWLETESGLQSFIFKPAGYPETVGRELWLQEHLIPHISGVSVPRILASSSLPNSDTYWMVMEDAGRFMHTPSTVLYQEAIDVLPRWHRLSVETLSPRFQDYEGITPSVLTQSIDTLQPVETFGWLQGSQSEQLQSLITSVKANPPHFFEENIVSHGDYHLGNIGRAHHGLVVLDWENAHVDCAYCDLYALLDKTHPRFPKPALSNEFRVAMLSRYLRQIDPNGAEHESVFMRGYFLYSVLHSLWMLALIERDVHADLWDVEPLMIQRRQTQQTLIDGMQYLAMNGGEPV